MTLHKYKYPLIFMGAQGKCGKVYMAAMLKSAITYSEFSEKHNKVINKEYGKCSHEWFVRQMGTHDIIGWHEPTKYLIDKYPAYRRYKFENALTKCQNMWNTYTIPKINEYITKGMMVDAESKFLVLSYYFIKRYIHPDSMKIIIMRRPLHSIAYHNCRVAGYKLMKTGTYYLGNLIPPWCKNNLTVPHIPIEEITQQELNVWYAVEMEERKKAIRNYFPDVDIMEWDMETDTKSQDSLDRLLEFVSSKHQKLKPTPWMRKTINKQVVIHLGPTKCKTACPDKEHCTEDTFKELVNNHKIIYNPEARREGLL